MDAHKTLATNEAGRETTKWLKIRRKLLDERHIVGAAPTT